MTDLAMTGGPTPAEALDLAERNRLRRLESTIERAVDAAGRIAGDALATIRDERLYRATHRSFEAYVIERFGFSRDTADRMIKAATDGVSNIAGLRLPRQDEDPPDEDQNRETAGQPAATCVGSGPAHRAWATVRGYRAGVVRLAVETDERPPVGARVEVVW